MLKTAGHVKKHYLPCCVIYEDFLGRGSNNSTLAEFMKAIESHASEIEDYNEQLAFKGDMLEIFADIFFKAFSADPAIGLVDYEPVPLEEDYGVDGFGVNAAGNKVPVQVKYRSNPKESVLYAEVARTYTSAKLQLKIPCEGKDSVYVFTTADDTTIACQTVFGEMCRVINRQLITHYVDYNENFWKAAYNEIEQTLLGGAA